MSSLNTKKTNVTTTSKLNDAKNVVIEKRKNQIKNSTSNIFENVDFMNLENKISKLNVKEKISFDKQKMYKYPIECTTSEQQKKFRTKMRNQIKRFSNNIILSYQKKNEIELKKEVKSFNDFYKENYILNDYSIISISSNNRDKETLLLIEPMLEIVKLLKSN